MFIVLLIINVFLFAFLIMRRGIRITPLFLMWITYAVFPMLAALPVMGTNVPDIFTFICAAISFIFFMIGYNSGSRIRIKTHESHYSIRMIPITIISVGILIFALYLLPRATAIRASSTWGNDLAFLRYYSNTLFGSSSIASLYEAVLLPATWAIFILSLEGILDGNRKAIFIFVINIATTIILSLCFAARANLVRCLFYAAFVLFSNSSIINSIKKIWRSLRRHKLIISLFIAAISYLLYYLTSGRDAGTGRSFLDNIYVYYTCPYKLFDYMRNNPTISKLSSDSYLYGGALMGSVVNLICTFFTLVLRVGYMGTDYQITQITAKAYPIGGGLSMNAATTAMYPFMRDLGIIGVIVGFFLWGNTIRMMERKQRLYPNIRNKSIYVLMLYVVWKLNMNYEALTPSFIISIIITILLTKRDAFSLEGEV